MLSYTIQNFLPIIMCTTITGVHYAPRESEEVMQIEFGRAVYMCNINHANNGISYALNDSNSISDVSDFDLLNAMCEVASDLIKNSRPSPIEFQNILEENWEDLLLV